MATTRPVSIENIAQLIAECDVEKSTSFEGDDSFTEGSSSSYEDHSDDDDESSYDSHDLLHDEQEEDKSQGLFLSSAMQNLLRRSVGSDSDLKTHIITQDPSIQKMTSRRRRGSDGAVNTPESKLVYVIQTKSATDQQTCTQPKPVDTLKKLLQEQGASTETRPAADPDNNNNNNNNNNNWAPWNSHGYTVELTDAVRKNDLPTIRQLHMDGHNLQCCNQFGESIVHTAARRGSLDVLQYLIGMAGVSLRVCCDNGRTPLQDACWTGQPNFDCVRFLLKECPDFLLLTDKRGLTPLEYTPKDTWEEWNAFLTEHKTLLLPKS